MDLKNVKLVAIASRPGIGKSSFAIDIINHVSEQTEKKILYFNLETSKENLQDFKSNVEVIDTPKITPETIKKKCMEVTKEKLLLLVIDYIQLMASSSHVDTLKDFVKELRTISIEFQVPIIVLSEVSKDFELQSVNIRETSPLLKEADLILFLDKSLTSKTDDKSKKIELTIIRKE